MTVRRAIGEYVIAALSLVTMTLGTLMIAVASAWPERYAGLVIVAGASAALGTPNWLGQALGLCVAFAGAFGWLVVF